MAAFTAQILVGAPHPHHGGITPTHTLFLSENSRPAWILVADNVFQEEPAEFERITWIPTVENILEDALLMIAIHVIKDKEILDLSRGYFRNKRPGWVELYEDIDERDLKTLHKQCRKIGNRCKIVLSVFLESSLRSHQLKALEHYQMDVEVCTPTYFRIYSPWREETLIAGSLKQEPIWP